MFRLRDGLLSISLQVTTTLGSCLMRGFRSSRSRLSRNKAMWCVSEGQQAGSLWPGGAISSSLSSGMITAATMSFRSRLHPSGLLVSSQISPCSAALRLMAPSSTLPLKFKRHGKVVCANLPSKFLKAYRQACPICLGTKRRRRGLPKSVDNKSSLALLKPWEVTHLDVRRAASLCPVYHAHRQSPQDSVHGLRR